MTLSFKFNRSDTALLHDDLDVIPCSFAKAADMTLDKIVGQKRERARYPSTIT